MAPARIYLVEDDHEVRLATRLLLQSHGYDVRDFEHAEEMLALTEGRGADGMILDIRLPGLSGIELLAVLRGRGISTPVVLVSAEADRFHKKALQAGAAHVLRKPYKPAELLAILSGLRA